MTEDMSVSFEADVRNVMSVVKSSLGAIFECLPKPLVSPHDVQVAFGIDKKLGWKLYRVISENDVFFAAQFVPGAAAFKKFLRAAAKHGVPSEVVSRTDQAMQDFVSMAELHAGDRSSFDLMLLSCSEIGRMQAYHSQQKAAFYANSHLLGVQAKTQFSTWFFAPSEDVPDHHDIASIRGVVDLRRNRPNVPWLTEGAYFMTDDGDLKENLTVGPLDETLEVPPGERIPPFWKKYCTNPLPEVVRWKDAEAHTIFELTGGDIGNTEASSCTTAQVARAVFPIFRTDTDRFREICVKARTPVETFLIDQFVHEDVLGADTPRLQVFGDFVTYTWPTGAIETRMDSAKLPTTEAVHHLGMGPEVSYTSCVPRYVEMVREVLDKMKWDGSRFHLYRVKLSYPVIPSSIYTVCTLPEKFRDG
jgi:hypothetical protein